MDAARYISALSFANYCIYMLFIIFYLQANGCSFATPEGAFVIIPKRPTAAAATSLPIIKKGREPMINGYPIVDHAGQVALVVVFAYDLYKEKISMPQQRLRDYIDQERHMIYVTFQELQKQKGKTPFDNHLKKHKKIFDISWSAP